jgi:hypothetical protein
VRQKFVVFVSGTKSAFQLGVNQCKEVIEMRKKLGLSFLMSLMAFALTFAGCGKKEEQQEAPPPPPSASAPAQSETPAAPPEQAAPEGGEQKAPAAQTAPGETPQPEKKDEGANTK